MTEEAGRPGRRQRSLHCNPAEQAMIRERAAAAGKTVSRYEPDQGEPGHSQTACPGSFPARAAEKLPRRVPA